MYNACILRNIHVHNIHNFIRINYTTTSVYTYMYSYGIILQFLSCHITRIHAHTYMYAHTHTPSHIHPQTHTSLRGEQRTAVEDENGERGTESQQGNDTVIRHIQTVTDVQLLYTTKPPQLECGVLHAHVAICSLHILHSVCSPPTGVPIQSYTCNVI